jgi:hypothetical protein
MTSSLHPPTGSDPALVDLDKLPNGAYVELPPSKEASELVLADKNSFGVLRLALPSLGDEFRHRSLESCFPYLRADRHVGDDRHVVDFLDCAHDDSFSTDSLD